MKLFIDSSDLDEIREALQYGISGVTTNPTTMAKAEEGFLERLKSINGLLYPGGYKTEPVSIQVTRTTAEGMVSQAKELNEFYNCVVKVPATTAGLEACRTISQLLQHFGPASYPMDRQLQRVNVTLVFSPTQALIAAQNGAWCVSPFLCRWKDHFVAQRYPAFAGSDPTLKSPEIREAGRDFLRSIVAAVKGTDCKVLAASIRSVEDVEDAIEAGCDIATVSLKVLKEMMQHPKTDEGLAKFMSDWEAAKV